jgi:hypothetical protein
MTPSSRFLRTSGLIVFYAGILLGLCLAAGMVWADLEADFYFGFAIQGEENLDLSCPFILAAGEPGRVAITLRNPGDRLAEPFVQVDVSGLIGRSFRDQLRVEPGGSQTASWEVGSGDVVFGHLILARLYQFQARGIRSADASCGILVLDVPGLSGQAVFMTALIVGALLAALGYLLWAGSYRWVDLPSERGGMLLLGGIVGLGILLGALGWWLPGLLALAASVLLTAILLARRISTRS